MSAIRSAVIIGGGIAGPVTALALLRAGIHSTIFEAHDASADGVGGILMLAPNGLDALKTIGAADAVERVGQPIRRMIVATAGGKRLAELPGLSGLPDSRLMWRSELYRVLHDEAVAQGVRVVFGKRLIGVDQTASGAIARFSDGSEASAEILIGADGIHSTVRTLIDPYAPEPEFAGLLNFGGRSTIGSIAGPTDAMTFAFGDRSFMGYWKESDERALWFVNLPSERPMTYGEAQAIPAGEWLRILREASGEDVPARDLLQTANPEDFVALGGMEYLRSVPHWYRGRMVLAGDSAHAPSSTSGQGASLAAESGIELARCLRDLASVPAAFAAYERLRRPRVEKIAAAAAKTNRRKRSNAIAKAMMSVVVPLAMKFFSGEKTLGPVHRFHIDWKDTIVSG